MSRSTAGPEKKVTLIPGDGVGPEIIESAKRVIEATGAAIVWETGEAGSSVFQKGVPSGVSPATLDSIRHTGVVLKGPLETPVGTGEKSANVTLRKLFETYGNLRPVREIPGVSTPYSGRGINLVIVRENVEDLYVGIEYRQTPTVTEALKLTSRKGCEKIARLAFEVARAEGRKRVHCATKANILKWTEGMMKQVFEEVARDYPEIEAEHILVDNCAHQLVKKPEQFEVIVTTNMNGDILSDLASGLVGGLGLAPSANLGEKAAIFEAVHGSAPKYAGKNVANPTALLLSGVLMLRHLHEFEAAALIENAVFVTLESGKVRTRDLALAGSEVVGTREFTDAVLANLGKRPGSVPSRIYRPIQLPKVSEIPAAGASGVSGRLVGVDVFVESGLRAEQLGKALETLTAESPLLLDKISNRGIQLYPATGAITDPVDHWCCRFLPRSPGGKLEEETLLDLLRKISTLCPWVHVEKLLEFW